MASVFLQSNFCYQKYNNESDDILSRYIASSPIISLAKSSSMIVMVKLNPGYSMTINKA